MGQLKNSGMLGDYKIDPDGKVKYEIDGQLLRVEARTMAQEIAAIDEKEMLIKMCEVEPTISRRWLHILQDARRQIAQDKRSARRLVRSLKQLKVKDEKDK